MRKLLNNPWFVLAMVALAIALAWSSLRQPGNTTQHYAVAGDTPENALDQALPGGNQNAVSNEAALKQLTIPKITRDPFVNTNAQTATVDEASAPALPDLVDTAQLTGIWSQNGRILVLLNDHIHEIGDKIGRLTIESASQDGVWLSHWRGRDFLPLGKSFVLKTPARQASTP